MAIDLTQYDSGATLASGTRTNSTIPNPSAAIVDGDFLLGILHTAADVAVTLPDGWTLIVNDIDASVRVVRTVISYRRASGEVSGPTGTYTWNHASDITTGVIWRIPGIILSGDPEDATRSVAFDDVSPMTWTTITTGTANSAVFGILGRRSSISAGSSSSYAERIDIQNIFVMADIQAAAGPTGSKVVTESDANDCRCILMALKAATAGGSIFKKRPALKASRPNVNQSSIQWAA